MTDLKSDVNIITSMSCTITITTIIIITITIITTTLTIATTTNLFMYLAHTCAADAHRQEAYPSRPKTLIHVNSQLAPSATLLPDKDANDTD